MQTAPARAEPCIKISRDIGCARLIQFGAVAVEFQRTLDGERLLVRYSFQMRLWRFACGCRGLMERNRGW